MSRFAIYTEYLLCSGLNNEDERQSAPLTETHIALPRAAPHSATRGGHERVNPQNREQGRYAYASHLRTYTQPAQLSAAGAQLAAHTQPALRTGLMVPPWHLLHISRRVIRGLIIELTSSTRKISECSVLGSARSALRFKNKTTLGRRRRRNLRIKLHSDAGGAGNQELNGTRAEGPKFNNLTALGAGCSEI